MPVPLTHNYFHQCREVWALISVVVFACTACAGSGTSRKSDSNSRTNVAPLSAPPKTIPVDQLPNEVSAEKDTNAQIIPPVVEPFAKIDEVSSDANDPVEPVEDISVSTVYTVAVVSDMNESYGSTYHRATVHEAIDWIIEDVFPDLVLSTGDMVAGQQPGLDYRAMWRGFHRTVTHPLWDAQIPFAITPGNHDASMYGAFREERAVFIDEWTQYKPSLDFVDDSNYPVYYAFKMGPALFISLDATSIGPISAKQRRWVAKILEANQDYPVKIAFGHVPLFPFAHGREREILDDSELEEIFNQYDVTMMISGHHHAYYPGQRDDMRLVSMACLGGGPRYLLGTVERSERSVLVFHYSENGILSLEAHRSSNWHETIARDTLPEKLNEGRYRIYRDDFRYPDDHYAKDEQ